MQIEPSVVIYAIVNFLILVAVLTKFLYKPIIKMMDDRQKSIDTALDEAQKAKEAVAGTEERIAAQLAEARNEADAILEKARAKAEQSKTEILAEARSAAEQMRSDAAKEIQQEKEQALADLKGQIADLALLATERLLAEQLTESQKHSLMDQYVKDVGQLQ